MMSIVINFATSADGVHWARDPKNPALDLGGFGAWDASGIAHPAGILDHENATYHLWYAGQAGEGIWWIGHAVAEAGRFVYLPLISRQGERTTR